MTGDRFVSMLSPLSTTTGFENGPSGLSAQAIHVCNHTDGHSPSLCDNHRVMTMRVREFDDDCHHQQSSMTVIINSHHQILAGRT